MATIKTYCFFAALMIVTCHGYNYHRQGTGAHVNNVNDLSPYSSSGLNQDTQEPGEYEPIGSGSDLIFTQNQESFGPGQSQGSFGPGQSQGSFGPGQSQGTFGPGQSQGYFGPEQDLESFGPGQGLGTFGSQPGIFEPMPGVIIPGQGNLGYGQGNFIPLPNVYVPDQGNFEQEEYSPNYYPESGYGFYNRHGHYRHHGHRGYQEYGY